MRLPSSFGHQIMAVEMSADRVPISFTAEEAERLGKGIEDDKTREELTAWAKRIAKKLPFLAATKRDPYALDLHNLALSKCYNCDDLSIWIGDNLVYPSASSAPTPNADLPDDTKQDYREAAAIANQSPRGSAALLRLAIQKIVVELGCTTGNLNNDIASLVGKGLDKRVQQSLDVVRVIGNNAVHPGKMDIRTMQRPLTSYSIS